MNVLQHIPISELISLLTTAITKKSISRLNKDPNSPAIQCVDQTSNIIMDIPEEMFCKDSVLYGSDRVEKRLLKLPNPDSPDAFSVFRKNNKELNESQFS